MKNKSLLFSGIITFFLIFLALSPNLKADLENNSIENAQKLADNGIIENNSTNPENYKLKNSISRREMLKIMINLSWNQVQNNCVWKFKDLPASDWWCKYAETALKLWYISPNTNFRPNDNVSKAETLKMIFKAKNIQVKDTKDWREWYVLKAYELWYSGKFFDYDSAATRSFVFDVWAKSIKEISSWNDLMCMQVITYAKNSKTWECVEFPNSCIPEWFEKVNSCSNQTSFTKYKLLVTFDNEMNKNAVESNLKVYPEIKYTSTWKDDKNLELVLNEEINKELDILVNILDNATKKSWEKLDETITKKFKISWETKVDFVSPEWKLTDKNWNITVRFSKPIISLTNLDNQNSFPLTQGGTEVGSSCPITITPNIDWKCVWITTSTFQFRPEKWFPAWARYTVLIPAWIKSISWDSTTKSKAFEILTPDFSLDSYSTTLKNDEKLNFLFNDDVSLEDFKNNFTTNSYNKDDLNFEYLQIPTSVEWTFETNKSWVSILPKTWEWWYNKTISFGLWKNMKSLRWNIWLTKDINFEITTNDILTYARPFVYLNKNSNNLLVDMKSSSNTNIITKTNPNILFWFEKEMELDKSMFSLNFPFELSYAKTTEYKNWKVSEIKDDKTQIVMNISWNIWNSLEIKVNLSKKAKTADKILNFTTKTENKILSYSQINYKKACLTSQNKLWYDSINNEAFIFNNYWKVNYIYEVQNYTNDNDCKYEAWKNKYIVQTSLNPETDYKLEINNSLLDTDNYAIDKSYFFTFKTWPALNEDKSVSIMDSRNNILVPKAIKPLWVSITSVNISESLVTVCEWDFDIKSEEKIKNEACNSKTIKINNLWFKPNISILDLENIYWKTFTKNYITLKVEKINSDKNDYEKTTQNYYTSKASYILSNISAVLKSWNNSTLWLYDFSSWESLDDEISKIESYKTEADYGLFWDYKWQKTVFDKNLDFTNSWSWIYKINWNNFNEILITLKSKEQIYLWNVYNYYDSSNQRIYTFLQTDKPIYKTWEKVNIKWVSRILTPTKYELNTWKINVTIRNSQYKELLNKDVTLDKNWNFDLSLSLEKDASLWNYTIQTNSNSISFAVEEYEKPDFKVESKAIKTNYLTNEKWLVEVLWEYYIWLPLQNWVWSYSVNTSKYNFDWWKTTWYEWWENDYVWWRYYDNYIWNNIYKFWNFTLDQNWKYTLWIDLDENEDKIYNISTTIIDPNTKKSISSSASFIGTKSNTFLWIKFDKYYYDFKDTAKIWFVSTDIEWNKKWNQTFKYKVYKIDYVDNEDWLWIQGKETLVWEKTLKTDNTWITTEDFIFNNYWEYRFEIETLDSKYKTTKTIYVSGGNILRPIDAENKIEVLSNKESYNVWENAEIVISSSVKWVKALLTVEKLNEVLYSKVIEIDDFNKKLNLQIKKEFLPNFTIWVYEIKDINSSESSKIEELKNIRSSMIELEKSLQKEEDLNFIIYDLKILPNITDENLYKNTLEKLASLRFKEQNILNEILPQYYIWSKDLKVNLDDISLKTQIKIDKVSYLPWDKQVIDLNITDKNWAWINWNLTLKIIDESLLALKNNTSSIKDYFYSNVSNEISTYSNISNIIKRLDFSEIENINLWWWIASEEMSVDNAVMDMDMWVNFSDLLDKSSINKTSLPPESAWTQDNSSKLRTEFKDLAFYNWNVEVKNWKAQIIVSKLPDNLTTWVISWFAYTNDTKVWDFENKFKVQKDLSILPQIPRFFLNWDIAKIGWLIVNNTSKEMNVKVDLDITNATTKEKSKTLSIKANSSSLVEFEVEIWSKDKEKNDITNLKLTAKENNSPNLSDTIILEKPIYSENSWEYVFTNWDTDDLSYEEKIYLPNYLEKNWYLEISLWATILNNLLQNIDKYLTFPYDDLYSKLSFLENVKIIEEIYKNAWKSKDFENIVLTDLNWKSYKVSEVVSLIKNDLKNYLETDNWLSYFKNCITNYYYTTCSDFYITWKYLLLWLDIDWIDNKKVLEYYKNELKNRIEKDKSLWITSTWINEFLPIALAKDNDFIKTYFKPNSNLINTQKLEYIKLYNLLWSKWENSDKYLQDLKNSLLIEARWTFLPSWNWNNSYSSALMLEILIENWSSEKLQTQNLARWILSNRNEEWSYYLSNLTQILKSINLYSSKVEDLKNVWFNAKAFLNSKELMSSNFDYTNKFNIQKQKFDLNGNINFWQDNSLWFEKTWTWKLYYDVWIRYFLPTSKLEPRDEWLIVSRNYYNYNEYQNAFKKTCFYPWWFSSRFGSYCDTKKVKNIETITSANKWDLIVWEVELIVNQERTNVIVKDFLPAWAEILNTNFDTTSSDVKNISWNNSNSWYSWFDYVEQKNDMVYLYANHLTPWTYKYTYVLKASYSWTYSLKPATAELLDKPEIWWRSRWYEFEIE